MGFTQEQVCTSRQNCVACRRDSRFRDHFEKQYGGKWECPLNIPIDAADEAFPVEILTRYKEVLKMQEERQKQMQEVQTTLDELIMTSSGDTLAKVEKVRNFFFPHLKSATKCVHSTKQLGEVDQVCCGGTVKKVAAYDCDKHTLCTDKKCQGCQDFSQKR